MRELPRGAGLTVLAVEPWAPFRYALATSGRLQILSGRDPDEELLALDFTTPRSEPTHLAWARTDGESMLYLRGRDSQLRRVRPDREALEELQAPPLVAIAGDAAGSLATLDVAEDQDVTLTRDGLPERECRPLDMFSTRDDDDEFRALGNGYHLAVSGTAMAYSIEDLGTFVSWSEGEDFQMCEGLMWGPIAFQGDDALLCAYSVEETSRVCRQTRSGDTTCIYEIATEWKPDVEMKISAIAWDPTRRTLWGASPGAGWFLAKEPGPGRSKGLLLS